MRAACSGSFAANPQIGSSSLPGPSLRSISSENAIHKARASGENLSGLGSSSLRVPSLMGIGRRNSLFSVAT